MRRASAILDDHLGTVLDFRYDGFLALFAETNKMAVAAAIKIVQEFQNEEDVTVHIVLDMDTVKSGVLGNEKKMQAVAISNSYNIGGKLLSFIDKAESNIFCTEVIHPMTEDYNCRYVGKVRGDGEDIRIYEIFNGDLPEVMEKKAITEKLFLDALYSFYSADYKTAKREFLEVVRENPNDGIAKYYLYLADSYEEKGEEKIAYIGE